MSFHVFQHEATSRTSRRTEHLPSAPERSTLCLMKLRTDLLKFATPEEALKEGLAQNHRYKPEPLFSQTGTGSLSSATTEECAQEEARSMERIRKALEQSRKTGSADGK